MNPITEIFVGMTTRNSNDADTDSSIVFIANADGLDWLQYTFPDTSQDDQGKGQANLYQIAVSEKAPLPAGAYFRIGIRGSDTWLPENVFIWGVSVDPFGKPPSIFPLAMTSNASTVSVGRYAGGGTVSSPNPQPVALSTDVKKGDLSFPILPVAMGDASMLIQRLLILMTTSNKDDSGTNDKVTLQISIGEELVVDFDFPTGPQTHLSKGQANFYSVGAGGKGFTKKMLSAKSITLSTNGDDAWLPDSFYIFGLDTPDGMATQAVPLVFSNGWDKGALSTDSGEGSPSVNFSIVAFP
jgi:hypothetical protein